MATKIATKPATKAKTRLVPLADRLVITPLKQEEMTTSGLVIPDTAKEKPQQGEVIAVGPGRLDDDGKRVAMEVAVGDRILYAKYTGTDIKIDNVDYIVLNEKEVLCKMVV